MKLQPNGNIQITVNLLPDAYAALMATVERDKCSTADVINIAVLSHNVISAAMTQSGQPLSEAMDGDGEAP